MAAPVFVAASAIGSSTAGSFSIVLPTHAANDILWVISWYRASATVLTPTNWTEAATALRGTTRYYLHWIRAADANTADPLFDYTGADDGFGLCVVYRGCITTGNPYDVLGAFTSGTVQSAVLTGITALTVDSLIVASIGGEDNTATDGPTTGTDPATYVEHYVEAATGTDGCVQIAEQAQTTTGATGNVTVAWSATVVGWGGWVVALIPPSATTFNQALAATAVGVATLTSALIIGKTLAATAVGVATLSRVATYFRALAATATGVAILTKKMFVTLSVTAAGVPAMVKKMFKTLSATATGVPALATALLSSVSMAATAVGAATLSAAMLIVRVLSATASGVASLMTQFIAGSVPFINRTRSFLKNIGSMIGPL